MTANPLLARAWAANFYGSATAMCRSGLCPGEVRFPHDCVTAPRLPREHTHEKVRELGGITFVACPLGGADELFCPDPAGVLR